MPYIKATKKPEKVSGIYEIINLVNNNRYVGSATNLWQRWLEHNAALKHQRHHNQHLQNAVNKYGPDCFEFCVVQIVSTEGDLSGLYAAEQARIDCYEFSTLYNIQPCAGSNRNVSPSQKTRELIRLSKLGKPRPQEMIDRISGENNWQYGKSKYHDRKETILGLLAQNESIRKIAKIIGGTPKGLSYYLNTLKRTANKEELALLNMGDRGDKRHSDKTRAKISKNRPRFSKLDRLWPIIKGFLESGRSRAETADIMCINNNTLKHHLKKQALAGCPVSKYALETRGARRKKKCRS